MTPNKVSIALDNRITADDIEEKLLHSLRSTLPQTSNNNFLLSARDSDDRLVGALSASTSYGWVHIETLWIDPECRRHGVGSALLRSAENNATQLRCHASWLDTSNPDAMRFYSDSGYEVFGQLSNATGQHPETHQRWFMKKSLQ